MLPNESPRTEQLVDLLLRIVQDKTAPEIKTMVGHRFPDEDVWLCCWMAKKWMPKAAGARIVFINAGQRLPGSEGDQSVVHFDTGGGDYDQHNKLGTGKICSAALLAQGLGVKEDVALKPLLDMVTAVDNIEPLPPTSIHFAIEGYPRKFRQNGSIDWEKVQERVFELFDIVYGQKLGRHKNRQDLGKYCEWTIPPNGLKVALLDGHPELRDAAFDQGAAVVVWATYHHNQRDHIGIPRSRSYPDLKLHQVVAELRLLEAQRREINVTGKNLTYIGQGDPVPQWFLHQSRALILNGSRTHKLAEGERTVLAPREVLGAVNRVLSKIPRETVSRWTLPTQA